MVLFLLRGAFVLLAASVTMLYILPFQGQVQANFETVLLMIGAALGVTGLVIAVDIFTGRKKLTALSGVFVGLLAGLLAAYALSFVVDLILLLTSPSGQDATAYRYLFQGVKVIIGLITCYLGISMVIQTKDDFRFVIPYVEFAKEIRGNRPTLLDTSVIIDGRVLDIVQTHTMQGSLIVPKFILDELQAIADSADKLRRARGRRGLDILQKLQQTQIIDITIEDQQVEAPTVDQKLVVLAQQHRARIMTNDYNLNKVASLRGVDVININDLAKALQPVVLPGEIMSVKIIRAGESSTQGVGYLEDGTMVVVESARQLIDQQIDLTVTSSLQTSAGRMIFGRANTTNTTKDTGSTQPSAPSPDPAPTAIGTPTRTTTRNPRRR